VVERTRVAALTSEYRPRTHADVIVDRVLGGYFLNGQHQEPRLELVSMYTDRVPDMYMSRDLVTSHDYIRFGKDGDEMLLAAGVETVWIEAIVCGTRGERI